LTSSGNSKVAVVPTTQIAPRLRQRAVQRHSIVHHVEKRVTTDPGTSRLACSCPRSFNSSLSPLYMASRYTREQLEGLRRVDLQKIGKVRRDILVNKTRSLTPVQALGLKANLKSDALIDLILNPGTSPAE
jgi:hypothetical protein